MAANENEIRVFLAGDVMTGRRIDARLSELRVIDFGRGAAEIWGDALQVLAAWAPHVRIVNLETSVTTSNDAWPNKRFRFRMHPDNVACLRHAGFDCCTLANNHTLDFGRAGLSETLDVLTRHRLVHAGAGADAASAASPACIELRGGRRVLVFSWAHPSSYTPRDWAAGANQSGINVLTDYTLDTTMAVSRRVRGSSGRDDLVVASIHWGPNWGYEVSYAQRRFARALIDHGGVDVVHGHSSHHPIGVEIYRGKPILYGCGDLINDYDHAGENAAYRPDIAALYFLSFDTSSKRITSLALVPMEITGGTLRRASPESSMWLAATLNRGGRPVALRSRLVRLRRLRRTRFRNCWEVSAADGSLKLRL